MYKLEVGISPGQMKKIHMGHRVRIKKGKGCSLMVHPETYKLASRAFSRNKGLEVSLSPQEIMASKSQDYDEGEDSSSDEDDSNDFYKGQGVKGCGGMGFKKQVSKAALATHMNDVLGTNYDYMRRAGVDNAIKNSMAAKMARLGVNARYSEVPNLSAGIDELSAPRSRLIGGGTSRDHSIIGRGGGMSHSYANPALQSQPFSANFQMQHFLPVQFQQFNKGGAFDPSSGSMDGTGGLGY